MQVKFDRPRWQDGMVVIYFHRCQLTGCVHRIQDLCWSSLRRWHDEDCFNFAFDTSRLHMQIHPSKAEDFAWNSGLKGVYRLMCFCFKAWRILRQIRPACLPEFTLQQLKIQCIELKVPIKVPYELGYMNSPRDDAAWKAARHRLHVAARGTNPII